MKILSKLPGRLYFRSLALDRELSSRGWNVNNLKQIHRTFTGIALNNARLTGRQTPHDVVLMKQCAEHLDAAVGLDKDTIYVFLRPGPSIVNRTVTLALAREMSVELFENAGIKDRETFLNKASIPKFYPLVDDCAASMDYYLSYERCLPADRDNLREIIEVLGSELSLRVMTLKTLYLLLHPRIPSRAQINEQVISEITDLEQDASRFNIEEDTVYSWRSVGTLAVLSLLARKYGCAKSAIDCQGRLWGELGRDLAVIELGTLIGDQDIVRTLKCLHRITLPEFNILFNGLLPIFDLYFNSTEGILRRLSAEKPPAS